MECAEMVKQGGLMARLKVSAADIEQGYAALKEKAKRALAEGICLLSIDFPAAADKPLRTAIAAAQAVQSVIGGREDCAVGFAALTSLTQLQAVRSSGARFAAGFYTDPALVQEGKRLGLTVLSGGFTLSELTAAKELGADFGILYPACALNAAGIRALTAALPPGFVLAAGVEGGALSLRQYLEAGCLGVLSEDF